MGRTQRPRRVRPEFPKEWGVPNRPDRWVTWGHAERKLKREKVYWLSTVRADGRPHAVPLWGVWHANAFFFESAPNSVKARNLETNPRAVVHIQDGYDTVIVEGRAVRETDPQVLKRLEGLYATKYDYRPVWTGDGSQTVHRVVPNVANAWKNPRMHVSAVRFVF